MKKGFAPILVIFGSALILATVGVFYYFNRSIFTKSAITSSPPSSTTDQINSSTGKIAVVEQYEDPKVWLMDINGTNRVQINTGKYFSGYPKFTPNGEKLLLALNAFDQEGKIKGEFYIYDIPAKKLTPATEMPFFSSWSSKGDKYAYIESSELDKSSSKQGDKVTLQNTLIIEKLNGEKIQYKLPNSLNIREGSLGAHGIADYGEPSIMWTTDDSKIAFSTSTNIGYIDIPTGTVKSLFAFDPIGEACGEQVCLNYWTPKLKWTTDNKYILTGIFLDQSSPSDKIPWVALKIDTQGSAEKYQVQDLIWDPQGDDININILWDDIGEKLTYLKTPQYKNRYKNDIEIYSFDVNRGIRKLLFEEHSKNFANVYFYRTPKTPHKVFIHINNGAIYDDYVIVNEETLEKTIIPLSMNFALNTRFVNSISPTGNEYIGGGPNYVYDNARYKKSLDVSENFEVSIYWKQ